MKFKLISISMLIAASGLCSCSGENADKAAAEAKAVSARAAAQKALADTASDEEPPPPPPEGRIVQAWRDGKMQEMHESEARAAGLSVIDLSDYWVPFIFSERDTPDQPKLPNHFRPIFRKLANNWPYESRTMAAARAVVEHRKQRVLNAKIAELRATGMAEDEIRKTLGLDTDSDTNSDSAANPDDKSTDSAAATATADTGKEEDETASLDVGAGDSDHYLEVYGIPPSLSVLRKRALEEVERPCFAEIDYNRIRGFDGFVAYSSNEAAKADSQKTRSFAMKLRKEIERLQLKDAMELREHPDNKMSEGLIDMAARYEALIESQKQLVCEGLYDPRDATRYRHGGLDWRTHRALVAFEKKNRIFGWGYLGKETLEALKKTPKERLFDSFMRVVAERVIDGTEIIEDGSARLSDGAIPKYKDEKGVEHEVPNLVAEYSSALIRHMDLTTPDKVIAFLKKQDDKSLGTLFVAIPMPPRPPYYSGEMTLHAVINRGDVWYEYPYTEDGREKGQSRKSLPTNTLYVKWNGQDIPLLTTNTTIGAWRTELAPDGYEYFKYKNSDVGPRVWKDIFAGPVWLPPDTAPTTDMIKSVVFKGQTVQVPNYDEFGPWYASAYGLVAGFHYRQVPTKSGEFKYHDNGIRSHGSVDYNSILRRYSHGCHRLYNHMAIRLFNFVLHHKKFIRKGEVAAGYSKKVIVDDDGAQEEFIIDIDSRGYKYELIDPVPVMVETGNIRGSQKTPVETYMPKPGEEYGLDAQFLPEQYKHLAGASSDTDTSTGGDTDSGTAKKE